MNLFCGAQFSILSNYSLLSLKIGWSNKLLIVTLVVCPSFWSPSSLIWPACPSSIIAARSAVVMVSLPLVSFSAAGLYPTCKNSFYWGSFLCSQTPTHTHTQKEFSPFHGVLFRCPIARQQRSHVQRQFLSDVVQLHHFFWFGASSRTGSEKTHPWHRKNEFVTMDIRTGIF